MVRLSNLIVAFRKSEETIQPATPWGSVWYASGSVNLPVGVFTELMYADVRINRGAGLFCIQNRDLAASTGILNYYVITFQEQAEPISSSMSFLLIGR